MSKVGIINIKVGIIKNKVGITNIKVDITKNKVEITNMNVAITKNKVGNTNIKVGITKNKVGNTNIKVGITKNKVGITNIKIYILKPNKRGEMAPKPFRISWSSPYKAQKQCYQNNSSIVIGSANPMVRGFLRFCYRQSSELGFVASPISTQH
jgi:hypothetical protein